MTLLSEASAQSKGFNSFGHPGPGNFFASVQSGHNLPTLTALAQGPQGQVQNQRPQSQQQDPGATTHHQTAQIPGYSLPGITQHQLHAHPGIEAERDREIRESREMEELARGSEQREREMRERQHREQNPSHENHAAPIHLHQPVAVAPSARAIHGPNGLLNNAGSGGGPSTAPASMSAGQSLFPGGAPHAPEQAARLQQQQQQGQQAQANHLVSFPQAGPGQQQSTAMNQAQQPILNDALSYLDQVKFQFADHPDVYNRFLDIMKDFKSGAIDTPGVIERVSHLFAGNPGLIQGFNTFLPPGYKIECGAGDDPNAIRVTTPMGTTVSTMPPARPLSNPRSHGINGAPASATERQFYDASGRLGWGHQQQAGVQQEGPFSPEAARTAPQGGAYTAQVPAPHSISPEAHREQHSLHSLVHQSEQRANAHLASSTTNIAAAGSAQNKTLTTSPGELPNVLSAHALNGSGPVLLQGAANGTGEKSRGPVEFNHAISYVNKIKNRFASQPDIYKQFLEILQTYQRESKPIHDVYAQVTHLFEGAPDLLEDFKQFLPESAAQTKPAATRPVNEEAFPMSSTRTEPGYAAAAAVHAHQQQTPRTDQPRLPPMGNFAPTPSANRDNKRKRSDRQGTVASGPSGPEPVNLAARGAFAPTNNGNKRLRQSYRQPTVEASVLQPSIIPAMPRPMAPSMATGLTPEVLAFFEKVKKHVGSKTHYTELLQLVALYTSDLIDEGLLLHRAAAFIGNNDELMKTLREALRYPGEEEVANNPPTNVHGRVNLANCRSYGPSYRFLPNHEKTNKCSGRDSICNEVLNDDWVSHPTWESEDSGFVAHRKNVHEEGLHRIEEERHDYDYHLEICGRTIQLLEPIASILHQATPEARDQYKLDPKLGGQSVFIYRRLINKVYGRDKGMQVVERMFLKPYDVIPTLLARLKSKQAEWKAAQAQWQKVWRTQTNQMFFKSLDAQGTTSRISDKRQFWPKQLVNEIQVRYEEHKRCRELGKTNIPDYQFIYSFEDRNVLRDATLLILTYAEANSLPDHPRLLGFMKEFVTLFFDLDANFFQDRTRQGQDVAMEDAEEGSPTPEEGVSPFSRGAGKKANLLRGVLERGRAGHESVASDSRGTTPDNASAADEAMQEADQSSNETDGANPPSDKWFNHPTDNSLGNGQNISPYDPFPRTSYHMYANQQLYCFVRLLGVLCERLAKIKAAEDEVHKSVRRAKAPKAAQELGWIDKYPDDFFRDTSPTANYYQQMLEMFESQIKGVLEMSTVEDALRRYYLQEGWQLYSLDKLLNALTRFAGGIFSPDGREKTSEIYHLFKKDRARGDHTTFDEEVYYRNQVDKQIKDGEMFRITYDTVDKTVKFRLCKKGDPTYDLTNLSKLDRWRMYVTSWENIDVTEGINFANLSIPYLRRSARSDPKPDISHQYEGLRFRVSQDDYHVKFERSGYEYGVMRRNEAEDRASDGQARDNIAFEKMVANSQWMAGMNKEDVEQLKSAFMTTFST
ncbi:hypothetical protein EJ06DRAFT_477465 [Trichodelitschia bisporula]|uniref:Histone deacetylase interacting domain-containing protein n=1 Tax=Trichodelitschia bisporula TaxID=703511 RepID=A0A6G1HWK6_9PEZI|nr:hypothetical protein EJ06DRAFT_477465 [Trichodelitschia bisporula]